MTYKDKDTLERLYVEQEMTTREIAAKYDCNCGTISYWLDKFDIPTRPQSPPEPSMVMDEQGRETFVCNVFEKQDSVLHHRLLMAVEHDLSEFDGKVVHHKNGVPWDNRLENLEFKTRRGHQKHHAKSGDFKKSSKLTPDDVRAIRKGESEDSNYAQLAREYGVSASAIRSVIKGESWKWVDDDTSGYDAPGDKDDAR